jgi:hypothetical protein
MEAHVTNRMRARWLRWALAGAFLGCGGATEPSPGNDVPADAASAAQESGVAGECDVVDAYDLRIVWDFEAATLASSFFTFHDDSPQGVQMAPAPGGPASGTAIEGDGHCGSRVAFRLAGAHFERWGAGAGNALAGYAQSIDGALATNGFPLYGPAVYDASGYDGLSFWARGLGDVNTFRVGFTDGHTDQFAVHALPVSADSVCTPLSFDWDGGTDAGPQVIASTATSCGNDFGASLTATADWRFYMVRFDQMAQRPGLGFMAPHVDNAHLFTFYIYVNPGIGYDLWFDDIGFFKKKNH